MDPLTVSSDRRDGWSVVEVAGELDIATAYQLGDRLAEVITANSPARIVLDMSKVDFCDASGLRVLVRAHHTARRHHGLLHLVCPKGKVWRLLRVAGLAEGLSRNPWWISARRQMRCIARRRDVLILVVFGRSDNAARCRSCRRAPARDYGTALR
ncbi:STAS domain-containing protein [Streptomyces sp. NPDC054919]